MLGTSHLRSRLLRRSRQAYNTKLFEKAARRARLTQFLFRDRESMDILARSNLRMKKFNQACKYYDKADRMGFALLDHEVNHFKAELGAENYLRAFEVLQRIKGKSDRKDRTAELVKRLRRLTHTERSRVIHDMDEVALLPNDIAQLVPGWSPSQIEFEEDEDEYTSLGEGTINAGRYKREISRIRSSGAYRISKHLTESVRHPIRILGLPLTLPLLFLEILRQRRGGISERDEPRYVTEAVGPRRDCIVMFPTNGVGFGHFTRLLAIARNIRSRKPSTEIVFFTTMPTLHVLAEENFVCYHMPGRHRYKEMDASHWNAMCEELMSLIFSLHRPRAFVFDGSYPYRGMLNAIKSESQSMVNIWVRRGAIRKGSRNLPVDSIGHFHTIIRPGDSVSDKFEDETRHNVPIVKTNPILLEDPNGKQTNYNLRKRLGVPNEAILCYIQLGAGQINEIDSELMMTLDALSEHPRAYAVVGESMLGSRFSFDHERVRVLRDYPNSRYFQEIDFTVIAGGYNSYHEIIEAGLPAICFPNLSTGRDDQFARASQAGKIGAMVVIKSRTREKIRLAIERMMDAENRQNMRTKAVEMRRPNGAEEAADWFVNQILS